MRVGKIYACYFPVCESRRELKCSTILQPEAGLALGRYSPGDCCRLRHRGSPTTTSAGEWAHREKVHREMRPTIPTLPTFSLERTRFDEDYEPLSNTRITTNFANLARGVNRQANLRNTLGMIESRFNQLASWDNANGDRYALELDIISVSIQLDGLSESEHFPLIEILDTTIIDRRSGQRFPGAVGNNFSSYVRDYDFSILRPQYQAEHATTGVPEDFGELHGNLFQSFVFSDAYHRNFKKLPVICLSVSSTKTYHRTANEHPILGVEYEHGEASLTDEYFNKMGMQVRYFMPPNSVAPFAFYFFGDLLTDYSNLELIGTISTMETFQKIYRPEIYNANSAAAVHYRPSLTHPDYSTTQISYDREERSRLATEQGHFAEEVFIEPHGAALDQWSTDYSALAQDRQATL